MTDTKNSSNSSGDLGNTNNQISPSKKWCFTTFNVDKTNIENILQTINSSNSSYIFGLETCPTTKKNHLQGYIEFTNKVRPKNMFNDNTIHWEKSKGNREANIKYCMKEDVNPYTNFLIEKPIKLPPMPVWADEIIKILEKPINPREIYWFFDDCGNTGKSSIAKNLCATYGAIILSGKNADMKYGIMKYKEKKGVYPELIIIDCPRSNLRYLSYTGVEEIKNGCFFSSKYECEMVVMNNPNVFVFANALPETGAMSIDRIKLYDCDKKTWLENGTLNDTKYVDLTTDSCSE